MLNAKQRLPLSPEQIERWQEQDCLLLPSFFDRGDTARMRGWVEEIASWPVVEGKHLHYYEVDGDQKRLSRTENFLPYHDKFRGFMAGCGIEELMAQLIGEPVVLFKEKINYKYPGTGEYPPHQDGHSHATSPYAVQLYHRTVMFFLDEATEENGCMVLASGYPKDTIFDHYPTGEIKKEVCVKFQWSPMPCSAGSIFVFNMYVPHYSAVNKTGSPRRTVFLTYNGISRGDLRQAHIRDRATPKPNAREIKSNLIPQTRLKD